ncbi:iron-sulfur cluster assembly scaffold protein [Candidatus Gottesmanbacteria bacterium]|nr:iron-sulfur cluster assembly scaffold protein [Candidatus Gottesmanbacteria bacterium]
MDIYREIILDNYNHPHNFGRILKPTVSSGQNNPSCGDDISMDIIVKNNLITDIKFHGLGCAISIASASLLTENVLGKNIDQINMMNKDDILKLLGITLTPTRLKCALLPLEVLHKTISLIQ